MNYSNIRSNMSVLIITVVLLSQIIHATSNIKNYFSKANQSRYHDQIPSLCFIYTSAKPEHYYFASKPIADFTILILGPIVKDAIPNHFSGAKFFRRRHYVSGLHWFCTTPPSELKSISARISKDLFPQFPLPYKSRNTSCYF